MAESIVHFIVCPNCDDNVPIPPQAIDEKQGDLWHVVSCMSCGGSFNLDCDRINSLPLYQWYEMIGLQDQTKA